MSTQPTCPSCHSPQAVQRVAAIVTGSTAGPCPHRRPDASRWRRTHEPGATPRSAAPARRWLADRRAAARPAVPQCARELHHHCRDHRAARSSLRVGARERRDRAHLRYGRRERGAGQHRYHGWHRPAPRTQPAPSFGAVEPPDGPLAAVLVLPPLATPPSSPGHRMRSRPSSSGNS